MYIKKKEKHGSKSRASQLHIIIKVDFLHTNEVESKAAGAYLGKGENTLNTAASRKAFPKPKLLFLCLVVVALGRFT